MIIGGSKKEVIDNIKRSIKENELNKKVSIGDPTPSEEEMYDLIKKFYDNRKHKITHFIKSLRATLCIKQYGKKFDSTIKIVGLENIKDIISGAIVTSNHFNPLDSLIVRKLIKEKNNKEIYIVIQDTNLAMPGFIGYLFNNLKTIPICKGPNYIIKTFKPYLKKVLDNNNYVLIYPEEEMWFNYRKPRPCKRGTYLFAAEMNVPIISCFTEIIDTDVKDNDEFNKVKYVLHVLKPIYPDKEKSSRENSKIMAEIDYRQKVEAYEKAYNKKLDYKFYKSDIAGYRK